MMPHPTYCPCCGGTESDMGGFDHEEECPYSYDVRDEWGQLVLNSEAP